MRETKGKSQGAKIRENRTALVAHLVQSVKEGGSLWEPMWNSVAMRPRNPMSGAIYQGRNRLICVPEFGTQKGGAYFGRETRGSF